MPDDLREPIEIDIKEVETNKKGEPAFNYLQNIIDRMEPAIREVALQPGLTSSARALATSIRKSYVQLVGRNKNKVPPWRRSIAYRQNKRRGRLYKSIKATTGRRRDPRNPYANVKVGGPGARQAALVEYGHLGSFGPPRDIGTVYGGRRYFFGHPQYYKDRRVPGKGFVKAGFVGVQPKIERNFERSVRRTEAKVAKKAQELAGK